MLKHTCLSAFLQKTKTAVGGGTRFDSVKNGLALLPNEGLIAVHDAVRPMASVTLIQNCFHAADEFGNGIAAIACVDTVRQKIKNGFEMLDRNNLWLMPQDLHFAEYLIHLK